MPRTLNQNSRRIWGWWATIGWVLTWLAGLVWALALLRLDRGRSIDAGAENLRHLWPFWIASAGIWLGLTAMWLMLRSDWRDNASGQRTFWRVASFVALAALGVRVAVLFTHEPSLSDDVYRYIFDGRNVAAGFNPYLVVPANRLMTGDERWPGEQQLLRLVTYPELATPYLPVSQAAFGMIGLTLGDWWSDPTSSARAFRVGFVVIELVMMAIVLVALKRSGRSAWWLALYAWHPLPISEIAGSGHQDVIGMALLAGSLLVFTAAPMKTWRWTGLLAMSAHGKPFTIPAAAFMLRGRPAREWIRCAVIGAILTLIILAPGWLIWGDHGRAYANWRETVDVLAEKFSHFGGVYEPVLCVVREVMPAEGQPAGYNLKQEWLARKICTGIFIIAAIAIYRSRLNAWNATRAMLFALVLLTTTAHPWYLLWALALAPIANSRALWTLSLTLPWGYAAFADGVHWKVPPWVIAAAYAPVLVALVWDVVLHCRGRERLTESTAC